MGMDLSWCEACMILIAAYCDWASDISAAAEAWIAVEAAARPNPRNRDRKPIGGPPRLPWCFVAPAIIAALCLDAPAAIAASDAAAAACSPDPPWAATTAPAVLPATS